MLKIIGSFLLFVPLLIVGGVRAEEGVSKGAIMLSFNANVIAETCSLLNGTLPGKDVVDLGDIPMHEISNGKDGRYVHKLHSAAPTFNITCGENAKKLKVKVSSQGPLCKSIAVTSTTTSGKMGHCSVNGNYAAYMFIIQKAAQYTYPVIDGVFYRTYDLDDNSETTLIVDRVAIAQAQDKDPSPDSIDMTYSILLYND